MKKLKKKILRNGGMSIRELIKTSAIFAAGVGMALLGTYIYDEKIIGYSKTVRFLFAKCKEIDDCYTIGLCRLDKNGELRHDRKIFAMWTTDDVLSFLENCIDDLKRVENEKSEK